MSKKWMLIIGGIVVATIALVGAQLLLSRNPSLPGIPSTTIAGSASSGGSATSATPTTTASVTTSTAGGGSSTRAGIAPSKGGNSGSANLGFGPFPPLPDPHLAAQKLTSPAPAGKKLTPLTDAPGMTISALKLGAVPDGSAYTIRLRPYGIGPSMPLGSRLVIRIDSSAPLAAAPANSKIVNANVIVLADTTHGGTVTAGGTYTATLTFRSDGTKMLPILSKAKLAK